MNIFKRKKRRSRKDLKAVVDKADKNGKAPDFEVDETTDVLDLAFEKARQSSDACREEARETIDAMKTIRLPQPAGTEKV